MVTLYSCRLGWTRQVPITEEGRIVFKILTDKYTGKRLLEMPRHRWKLIPKLILNEQALIHGIGLILLRMRIIR